MTNEEAISLLTQVNKILVNSNSWLENTHEPLNMAFDMAIKALERESFMNKPCVSAGVCEHDKVETLDRIRTEIEELDGKYLIGDYAIYGENIPKYVRLWNVLQIIGKYKTESEDKE